WVGNVVDAEDVGNPLGLLIRRHVELRCDNEKRVTRLEGVAAGRIGSIPRGRRTSAGGLGSAEEERRRQRHGRCGSRDGSWPRERRRGLAAATENTAGCKQSSENYRGEKHGKSTRHHCRDGRRA